jgi:hypothetical protein
MLDRCKLTKGYHGKQRRNTAVKTKRLPRQAEVKHGIQDHKSFDHIVVKRNVDNVLNFYCALD